MNNSLAVIGPLLLIFSVAFPLFWIKKVNKSTRIILFYFILYKVFQEGLLPSFSFVSELVVIDNDNLDPIILGLSFISFTSFLFSVLIVYAIKLGLRKRQNIKYNFWNERVYFKESSFLLIAIIILLMYVFMTDGKAITDPRYAYQSLRLGIGFIWAGFISFSSMWFVVRIINGSNILVTLLVYGFFCYVSGSKGVLLAALIPIISYPRFSFSNRVLIFALLFPIFFMVMLYLFGQFSSEEDFFIRATRYFSQFHNLTTYYKDYIDGSIDLFYGEIQLSRFWSYIPRVLYEGKPYSYGSSYLVGHYWPGMAETGHTPSFGMYTTYFADFGFFGALLSILTPIKLFTLYAVYIISSGGFLKSKTYIVSYAVLIVHAIYFHIPITFAVLLMFLLLKTKHNKVHRN